MSVSAATTPTYPVAGRDIVVNFAAFGGGNYLKGYFTDAPIGSSVKTKLTNSGATRLQAFAVDVGKAWLFSADDADVGGVYTLQVEQYTKGAAPYGGGFQDAPAGFQTETLITSSSVTLQVGQQITQKVGIGADTATLTVFVVGSTVRASSLDTHGFVSPRLDDPKSKKAVTASLNPGVVAAVAALVDHTATDLLGDIVAILSDMIDRFYVHIGSTIYHAHADSDNVVPQEFRNPNSPEGLKRSGAAFLQRLDQHMRNDTGGGTNPLSPIASGTGSASYHVISTKNVADWANALLTTSTGDVLDTFVAIADAWRAYSGHLASTAVHLVADGSDTPMSLPPLLLVHELFLAELQKQSPTAPPSVNDGVTALIHGAGFEEP